MRQTILITCLLITLLFNKIFSQNNLENTNVEKDKIELIAQNYLNFASDNSAEGLSSALIHPESLNRFREHFLSTMASFGNKPIMGIVSIDSLKSMTPAQLYDYFIFIGRQYSPGKLDPKPEWSIIETEFKTDSAIVTYSVKNRGNKEINFLKHNNEWKMILSFESIF